MLGRCQVVVLVLWSTKYVLPNLSSVCSHPGGSRCESVLVISPWASEAVLETSSWDSPGSVKTLDELVFFAFARRSSGRLSSSQVFGLLAFSPSFIASVFFLALLFSVVICQKGEEMR